MRSGHAAFKFLTELEMLNNLIPSNGVGGCMSLANKRHYEAHFVNIYF